LKSRYEPMASNCGIVGFRESRRSRSTPTTQNIRSRSATTHASCGLHLTDHSTRPICRRQPCSGCAAARHRGVTECGRRRGGLMRARTSPPRPRPPSIPWVRAALPSGRRISAHQGATRSIRQRGADALQCRRGWCSTLDVQGCGGTWSAMTARLDRGRAPGSGRVLVGAGSRKIAGVRRTSPGPPRPNGWKTR
jgi:hypothetical protein